VDSNLIQIERLGSVDSFSLASATQSTRRPSCLIDRRNWWSWAKAPLVLAAFALAPLGLAPSAQAGSHGHYDRGYGSGYGRSSTRVYDRAKVLNVEPLFEQVSYSVPTQDCRDEQVAYHRDSRGRRSITGPLLGAVIGGAIGNAVGSEKRNKQVGTAVGALLGGSIGADVTRHRRHRDTVRYRTEQVCHTEHEIREEQRSAGYRVTYAYAGQTHTTRLQRDPGATLRVRVNVTPAG